MSTVNYRQRGRFVDSGFPYNTIFAKNPSLFVKKANKKKQILSKIEYKEASKLRQRKHYRKQRSPQPLQDATQKPSFHR